MTNGRGVAGTYEARLTSITPYVAWTPGGRASAWTAASYGRGTAGIDDALAGTRESAATIWTGAAGVNGRLLGGAAGTALSVFHTGTLATAAIASTLCAFLAILALAGARPAASLQP